MPLQNSLVKTLLSKHHLFKRTIACTLIFGILGSPLTEAKTNTYNMSYVYYGETSKLIQNVDTTKGALQAISPSYFEVAENGSLHISDSMDPVFVDAMHTRNMKVIPYLGNEFNRGLAEKALQNRDALSTQIAAAVKKYNWDGINVDLENITVSSKTALVDFVKLLRSKLPADKEVSIAVPANPNGLEDAYNLKALAATSDYIMLMAYDEHFPGDPTVGPVAGLPFVEKSIKYALTQLPSSQLVLGIPFYGRLWNGQTAYDGAGVTNVLASTLAAKYGGKEYYDVKEQSVRSEFSIGANDPVTKVFGQPLPNGSYTLWYENERSLKAKLELVQKYKLKGTGSWSLNQATSDTWSYYDSWSNGLYYIDLQNHWSQQQTTDMINKGWMIGISSTLFAPDISLTRAQAATIMARALGNSKKIDKASSNIATASFLDVSQNYWAYSDIVSMTNLGIIAGIGNQLFAPDAPITREEISSLISRVLNLQMKTSSAAPFSDVSTDRWSYSAIASLAQNHILLGFEDGSFHPTEPISRAQMAVILSRVQDQLE